MEIPSNENYVRNYQQERKTAKKRGETGCGSKSKDARRHRARRAYIARNGALSETTHVDHKKALKSGGSDAPSNLHAVDAKTNTSEGGKIGNTEGKRKGALKGHASRRKKKGKVA